MNQKKADWFDRLIDRTWIPLAVITVAMLCYELLKSNYFI